jgi:hypothetical protein
MGHERLGILPKTQKWRVIVSDVASAGADDVAVSAIADKTLAAIGTKYNDLGGDESVRAAFSFLVDIARSASSPETAPAISDKTPLALVLELSKRIHSTGGSLETRELVIRAAADALSTWHRDNSAGQPSLFEDTASQGNWNELGNGAGFCEISRLYFSKLTERYLNYFLEREASSVISDLGARERFKSRLSEHVSEVSHHSFESAKITQSFAAGWFNKHALTKTPSEAQIKKFLAYAFQKMREEFRREVGQ